MPQVIIEKPKRYSYIPDAFAYQFVASYDPNDVDGFWDNIVAPEWEKQNPSDPLPEDPPVS